MCTFFSFLSVVLTLVSTFLVFSWDLYCKQCHAKQTQNEREEERDGKKKKKEKAIDYLIELPIEWIWITMLSDDSCISLRRKRSEEGGGRGGGGYLMGYSNSISLSSFSRCSINCSERLMEITRWIIDCHWFSNGQLLDHMSISTLLRIKICFMIVFTLRRCEMI